MKYRVIIYKFTGVFTFDVKTVGFKTKSLYLARLQAKLQKRFRRSGTPIAIVDVYNFKNIIEWTVPWTVDEVNTDHQTQDHIMNLPDDDFYDT